MTAQTAGNVAAATPLLDLALMETDDPALITTACHLQCRVQMWSGQPIEARDELLDLAGRTRGADPVRAAAMRSQAALLSLTIGDQHLGLAAASEAAADVAGLPPATRLPIVLVHALGLALANDTAGARALLAECEPLLAGSDPLTIDQLPVVAANTYASVEEPEAARRWLEAGVRSTRSAGAVGLLPFLLTWLAAACWRDGDWPAALTHAHAAVELAQETGWATEEPEALAVLAEVEAGLGMEAACREHAARATRLGVATGVRIVEARAEHALGLLELGAGRPDVAVAHLTVTAEFALAHGLGSPVLLEWAGDLVEAHIRAGSLERARRALARARTGGGRAGTPAGRRDPPALLRAAAGRRRRRRARLRRSAAPPRRGRAAVRGGAHPAVPGRAPAAPAPARRGPRGAGRRAARVHPARRDGVGAARRGRAAGDGHAHARPPPRGRPRRGDARGPRAHRPRPGPSRGIAPRTRTAAAHPAGAAGGTRRRRRGDQRRGGRPAVPVAEDDRVPPVERLPQARHPVACRVVRAVLAGSPTPA